MAANEDDKLRVSGTLNLSKFNLTSDDLILDYITTQWEDSNRIAEDDSQPPSCNEQLLISLHLFSNRLTYISDSL